MKKVKYLQRPYPTLNSLNLKVLISLCFGVFVFLFLSVFQPFGIESISENKYFYSAVFGIITALTAFVSFVSLPLVNKYLIKDVWKVKHEIVFILLNLLVISLINYSYSTTLSNSDNRIYSMLEFVFMTFSIGIIPVIAYVLVTESFLSNKYRVQVGGSEFSSTKSVVKNELIKILSTSVKESVEVLEEELFFIKSEENYCAIWYFKDGQLKSKLLRIALSKVEKQLSNFPQFIRCHRSYLVNGHQVDKVTGNARGYSLHLKALNDVIPVSRNFPKEKLKFENLLVK